MDHTDLSQDGVNSPEPRTISPASVTTMTPDAPSDVNTNNNSTQDEHSELSRSRDQEDGLGEEPTSDDEGSYVQGTDVDQSGQLHDTTSISDDDERGSWSWYATEEDLDGRVKNLHPAEIPHPDANVSPFLQAPTDIRKDIFRLLLTSQTLGRVEAISRDREDGAYCEYALHPAIIQTCKLFRNEACEVLYGENIFIASCSDYKVFPVSALTRYWTASDSSISDIPGILNVKRWKVVLSALKHDDISSVFGEFCKVFVNNKIQTLEVSIIPRGVEATEDPENYLAISTLLSPLEMLRSIPSFTLGDADYFSIPDSISQRDEDGMIFASNFEEEPETIERLAEMVTGTTVAEYPFEMLPPLIAYVQCFERFEAFKIEMALKRYEFARGDYGKAYTRYSRNGHANPFRAYEFIHPVEKGLMKATNAQFNSTEFHRIRASLLEHLEDQYVTVFKAASAMRKFILEEKQDGGFFDINWRDGDHIVVDAAIKALLHTEAYANAFKRSMPVETALEIRKQKGFFESLYAEMDREKAMLTMERDLDLENFEQLKSSFVIAVDDMDRQFLEMRSARRDLFRHDLPDTVRPIETDKWIWEFEDMVDWSQNED